MNGTSLAKAPCLAANDCSSVEAVTVPASMPLRGRLDLAARSVVVTARFGQALVLQRIGLNTFNGVAACLRQRDHEAVVDVVLRHKDSAYTITLEKDLPLDEAVAIWRGWADKLSVAMLLGAEDGTDSLVRDMLGAVHVGPRQPHRKGVLTSRRPRFAKRRGLR